MTSDIDRKKIKVATEWISKLANGVNPIDDSILSDNDIVNNVHVSRCLFFVVDILEGIGKKKTSVKTQHKQEFLLTEEIAAKVYIARKTGIAMFVKEINVVIPEDMKALPVAKVTQWLVSSGYLEERERSDGRKYKAPTELGISIGITSVWKDGQQGRYLAVEYDSNAQNFILENLFK